MSSRLSRMTLLALTASLLLSGPRAMADNVKGSDARAEASDVATEAYAGQALQDPGPALTPDVPEAVLYDNGPLITHPTGGAGGAAASALQTAAGLTVFGFANSISGGFRIADDFTVPAGGWALQTVRLFNYQTNSGNTSTINNINLQIWNGAPNAAGSVVVFGDATTNRLASSTWSNIYRTLDTDLANTARPIMVSTVTAVVTLPAGTYWLDWQVGGTLASGPWQPPITILGQTTTGNAMQKNGATWAALVDGTFPQGAPFILDGTGGGPCTAPSFAGLTSATNAGTSSCAINLAWSAATACPGTTVKYNVYRSTVSGTPPSAATLLQSCVTGLTYTDASPTTGTPYFYIVRAEDNTTTGGGPCNGGATDTNTTQRTATASQQTATIDNVESGGTDWNTTGGTGANIWAIVNTRANSPTRSWFVDDPASITDQYLRKVTPIAFPATPGVLTFFHSFTTESTYDGHVLEYSLDGGTTWSDILAAQGTVPANLNRFTLNGYNATISGGFQSPIAGRRAWSGAQAAFQEVRVNMADFINRSVTIRFRFASDNSVAATGVWIDDIGTIFAGACTTVPTQAAAPAGLAVDTAGNGVYQPNETVIVAPSWRNTGTGAIALTGVLSNHTGPAGPVYTIPDNAASYGTIPVAGTGTCSTGGNCYSVANTTATRPATHWDSTALETVTPSGATKTWTLHVGNSFTDVPASNPFFRFVETILHKNVTGGCSPTTYCPAASTSREQMAVFVLVAKEPAGFNPPACGATPRFTDVPASSPFCKWIEELARRGVVSGCTATTYCPTAPASREQMAVFVLRTLDPTLNPPACGTPMFGDVPASSPFCKWIEELVRRGVVTGCGGGNYCPTANVTRDQMGVFLTQTFGLTLYGL